MIQQTSLNAWQQIQEHLGRQREIVLTYLKILGEANNKMISAGTNLPINVVTARMNELRQMRIVVYAKTDVCPYTKKHTMFWRARE